MAQSKQFVEVVQSFPFEFYGDVFSAYLASDKQFYIRLDNICDAIGIEYRSQLRRISDDEAVNDKLTDIEMETPYQNSVRMRKVTCLNLRALPYWLGTIDVNRVRSDIRSRVILFKRDFVETAWFVYKSEILPPDLVAEMDMYATPQERELSEIVAQFRDLKRALDIATGKTQEELASLGLVVHDLDERFTALEAKIVPELPINPQQAWQLSEMIKAVGTALWETRKYGKSESYALVQDDFKNQFGIHIYSALPASRMGEAIDYLAGRYRRLKPGGPLPDVFTSGHQKSLL